MPKHAKMLSSDELQHILSPDRLPLPASPKVRQVLVGEYQDSTGEDSLEVYVVLDDDVPEDETLWPLVEPIFLAIRDAIAGAGDSRFAYISAGTPADLKARAEYEPGGEG